MEEVCLALRSTWCVWTRCAKIKGMYTGNTRSRWAVLSGTTTQCTHQIWAYIVGSVVTRRGVVYGHLYSPLSIGFSTQDTAPIIFLFRSGWTYFPFRVYFGSEIIKYIIARQLSWEKIGRYILCIVEGSTNQPVTNTDDGGAVQTRILERCVLAGTHASPFLQD